MLDPLPLIGLGAERDRARPAVATEAGAFIEACKMRAAELSPRQRRRSAATRSPQAGRTRSRCILRHGSKTNTASWGARSTLSTSSGAIFRQLTRPWRGFVALRRGNQHEQANPRRAGGRGARRRCARARVLIAGFVWAVPLAMRLLALTTAQERRPRKPTERLSACPHTVR